MSFAFQNGLDMRTKEYLTFLFHYIDDFKANAVNLFGYEGTFVPSVMAYNSGQIGSYKPDVIFNKNFSASIFDIIYRYYLASDDKKFMQEVGYEFASRIAQFFLSSLKLNKQSKMFDSSFGISPFSTPKGQSAMLYQSPTVDFENCKYIFYCMAKLSGEFDEDASRASVWFDAYAKVPDMEVDKDGIIKEYNIGSNQTDNCSPFLSHTFPYNLGTRAMSAKRDYDALIAGSAKYRFSCCCGKFSSRDLIEIALALATCGEGEDCFFVLETLLQGFLMNNLMFSFCDNSGLGIGQSNMPNYVNIDVSTAFCACLTNIFLTSSENNVYLFKTLPKRIENAVINGLTIKKGVTAFLSINTKRRIVILKLSAQQDEIVNIFVPNSYIRHVGSSAKMDRKECVLKAVELKKNKPLKLKIFY